MKDVSTQPIAETITPLGTPKKDSGADRDNVGRRYRFRVLALVFSFMVLIAGGGWLLHFLSKKSLQPETIANPSLPAETAKAENKIEPPQEPPPDVDPARLELEKANAEQKLAEYLEAKGELDQKAASEWAAETYLEITELGRQADAHFMEKRYNPASGIYDRAKGRAAELTGRADAALQRLLTEGNKALDAGDGTLARHNFTVALKIAPTDAGAQKGLKRAETVETVMQLIRSGEQHETNNALSPARTDYSAALEIDADSEKARQGLSRINGLIKEEQFQQLMSVGLAAFHRNDYEVARTRLMKAKSLNPGSRDVANALFQVDQAIRLSRIDRLRLAAQTAERSEDWRSALKSYLAVLDIDKNLQFAVLLLTEAKTATPRGPILTAHIKKLEKMVELAQTPVKIAIESDNNTRVAVYKVGKFGRFSIHELELRPGTYTVVGTRDGYQDVRQKIVVKPGLQSLRITVKCRVKI